MDLTINKLKSRSLFRVLASLIIVLFMNSTMSIAQEAELTSTTKTSNKLFDTFDEEESISENVSESNEVLPIRETLDENLSTSEKLEALKQEVIAVNRDLFILEEDLLFPASTQVALYFSVDIGYFFALDNLKLKIDDKQVSHHLYTENDVNALYRGAIQKPYIGNLSTGEHELVAVVIGTGPHNREYRKAVSFTFEKKTGAKAIEIQLRDDSGKMQPDLNIVEW